MQKEIAHFQSTFRGTTPIYFGPAAGHTKQRKRS
jgi:hypothetical protein